MVGAITAVAVTITDGVVATTMVGIIIVIGNLPSPESEEAASFGGLLFSLIVGESFAPCGAFPSR